MKERYYKIPKIRFNKYLESWKKQKYEDVIEVNSGKDYKHLTKGDIPVYGTGGYMLSVSEAITNKDGVGIGRKGTINKPYILKAPYWTVDTLFFCIPKNKINLYFINSIFERTQWDRYDESTGVPSLSKLTINNIQNYFPSFDEQSAIGSLFRTLDDLLASYKDNLANYQSLKATMLSKMFPKDGQTVPEIRLDGFEGEWEINKLNKYLAVSKQKNTQLKFDKEDVLSVSGEFGIINQIQFQGRSFAGASVEMYSIVDTGNIVYTKSPLKANPYGIIKTNYGIPGIVSTLYAVYLPNENVFPGFVERYFENDLRLNSYLKPLVNKGAKNDMKVSDENALLGAVIFPQLEEQVAISDYFTNLDKFIQSHKDKITQLETLKKKLLQNMFI